MNKAVFAIKINKKVVENFKEFCNNHGIKYSFFVEDAIRKKLEEEELKEDLLDLKRLRKGEERAVSFEQYLKERNV